jgi:hypothetical protein
VRKGALLKQRSRRRLGEAAAFGICQGRSDPAKATARQEWPERSCSWRCSSVDGRAEVTAFRLALAFEPDRGKRSEGPVRDGEDFRCAVASQECCKSDASLGSRG